MKFKKTLTLVYLAFAALGLLAVWVQAARAPAGKPKVVRIRDQSRTSVPSPSNNNPERQAKPKHSKR